MRGLVIKSTGSCYLVHFEDNTDLECHIKGNFRIRGIRSTNPVAVGDYVEVTRMADGTNWITEVCDRRNYIVRRSTNLSKESHILAANLDQAALLVTINHPATSTTFIDRFLAVCEAYRVPVVLLFNKVDLLSEEELEILIGLRRLYESIGYPTYALSAKQLKDNEITELKQTVFANRVTLLSGNSGVGKSTLLNALSGYELARTGAISDVHNKGTHTTTFSEMYPIDSSAHTDCQPTKKTWIIDPPGIKGFGTIDMQKEEVGHYFREIFRTAADCRYSNCTHTGEPGCAVYDAVVRGEIAESRFASYLSLLGDCSETKYR